MLRLEMTAQVGTGLLLVAALAAAAMAWPGAWQRRASALQAGALVGATALLLWALLRDDFSLQYVAHSSSRAAPTHLKVSALWAGMSGSLLFFVALAGATVAVAAWTERHLPEGAAQHALQAMGLALAPLVALVALGAPPFRGLEPAPPDGAGMAPVLQDHWLMLVHPPALYLGAVTTLPLWGLSIAGLWRGALGAPLRLALRRWALVAFACSSAGILLGAWWAWAVLGWGGYWAWDPVENVSLLPWLTAVALLHALVVHERTGRGARACLLLGAAPFVLVVLGAFVTRSGAIGSVHAFARSSLGPAFLALVALLVGAALIALLRGRRASAPAAPPAALTPRGGALTLGALALASLAAAVLAGTVAPLLVHALTGHTVTVAAPFYLRASSALALALLLLMGVAPALPWAPGSARALAARLRVPVVAATCGAVMCVALGVRQPLAVALVAGCAFALAAALHRLALPVLRAPRPDAPVARRALGAVIAHAGVATLLIGVTASSVAATTATGTAGPRQEVAVGSYRVRLEGLVTREEPHRRWVAAELTLVRPDGYEQRVAAESGPRLTFYPRREAPVSSPAVRADGLHAISVSLTGFDPDTQAAGLSAHVFPAVDLVWGALPLLLLGALLGLLGAPRAR